VDFRLLLAGRQPLNSWPTVKCSALLFSGKLTGPYIHLTRWIGLPWAIACIDYLGSNSSLIASCCTGYLTPMFRTKSSITSRTYVHVVIMHRRRFYMFSRAQMKRLLGIANNSRLFYGRHYLLYTLLHKH
jgi:hypothetical protein